MLHLAIGGPSWVGWYFGKYGKASEWRLHAPNETAYVASEIADLRQIQRDIGYLEVQVKKLQRYVHANALHFGPRDALKLLEAMEVLQRASKEISRHRLAAVLRV